MSIKAIRDLGEFHDDLINYDALAKKMNIIINTVVEYGRKFDGAFDWKSGKMHHIKQDNVELFSVCHRQGAMSTIVFRYSEEFQRTEMEIYATVRKDYTYDEEKGIEYDNRQYAVLHTLLSAKHHAITYRNGEENEYVDHTRIMSPTIYWDYDKLELEDYMVSDMFHTHIVKMMKWLDDIMLLPFYFEESEK